MTNEIQIFQNSGFDELCIIEIEGKSYFPTSRCAGILTYSNTRDAIDRHCKDVVKHAIYPFIECKSVTLAEL